MKRIAVVFGFSERGTSLAEQFILSFDKNIISEIKEHDVRFDIHAFKCNFDVLTTPWGKEGTFEYQPFKNAWDFDHIHTNADIFLHDCYLDSFDRKYLFPDIGIYQEFLDKYVPSAGYDYIMFCHDDIAFFNKCPMIDAIINIVESGRYNIVCNISVNCNEDVSIRFHPAMVFLPAPIIMEANLSFINDLELLDSNNFKVNADGGAKLLNSYYNNENRTQKKPFVNLPEEWYTHIRGYGDTGVEFAYILGRTSRHEFYGRIEEAKRNVDFMLYGNS